MYIERDKTLKKNPYKINLFIFHDLNLIFHPLSEDLNLIFYP